MTRYSRLAYLSRQSLLNNSMAFNTSPPCAIHPSRAGIARSARVTKKRHRAVTSTHVDEITFGIHLQFARGSRERTQSYAAICPAWETRRLYPSPRFSFFHHSWLISGASDATLFIFNYIQAPLSYARLGRCLRDNARLNDRSRSKYDVALRNKTMARLN